ncbi:DUF5666 domain-containing protein [Niveibacterium sp. 24ML]|uniref:DUF5666 domain-containing protein n=1 Tax=Niveibacterium sp. 24ML TaxID=2985512 RepID=UPI00226FF2C9|nr:DUF5666 domain-containing protein [Niveibacterium sp. 24ML]MCX9155370.1 DUF5666 domain-containing protein [Niveibacterium sp. 24ML]
MKLGIKGWIAAIATGVMIAACGGGGGGDSGVGSGGTGGTLPGPVDGFGSGTVTGFGSVIIDGVRFDDSSASIETDRDPSSPSAGTSSDVKLGMKVESELSADDKLKRLTVSPEFYGRISALNANGFVAAGQTIVISTDPATPTVFEGAGGLADLAVGDIVEVHGARNAQGEIVATRIERKAPWNETRIRVVGTLAELDTGAKSFKIGDLIIDYASANLLPAGATLTSGQRVAVWSTTAISNAGVLSAQVVRIKNPTVADGAKVRLGGLVTSLDTAAATFRLAGVPVDAKNASFEKGTAADLANGRAVRVEGSWKAGVLLASKVRYLIDKGDAGVELTGAITDFVSTASFTVRGVPVDASSAEFSGGKAENLANGVIVKIEGAYENGVVKATEVKFSTTPDGGVRTFPGKITAYDAATGDFRLNGFEVAMRITDSTVFTNANGSAASKADFANGKRVLVRGSFVAGVLNAQEVKFVPDATVDIKLEGLLYALDSTNKTFIIKGVTVRWNDSTVFDPSSSSAADLANGVKVEVRGSKDGNTLLATKIEIKRTDLPAIAEVKGVITDFVSASNFKVGGQAITTTSTTIYKDGTASSLAAGRSVEVKGTLSGSTISAAVIEFED